MHHLHLAELNALNQCLGYMHCKYLGSDQHAFGSIVWLLCFQVLPNDPLANLLTIWPLIKDIYAAEEVTERYKFMGRLTMFCPKGGACKLRGKAVELKTFGQVILVLWARFMNNSLTTHKQILADLKLNREMESVLEEHT